MIAILRGVLPRAMLLLALVAAAATLAACGGDSGGANANANAAAGDQADDTGLGPIPTRRNAPEAIEPVAGESGAYANLPTEQPGDQPVPRGASASGPAIRRTNAGPTSDAAISDAEVLKNGIALPPIEAPEPVREIIRAGNQIARTPYLWGGGHGKWVDKGYDCSGSISYALASAGLLGGPLDSGRLMDWGAPGKGKWVTIYTNPGHVFMVVAGVRFDTSGTRSTGSRWQKGMRPLGGYVVRHPRGL